MIQSCCSKSQFALLRVYSFVILFIAMKRNRLSLQKDDDDQCNRETATQEFNRKFLEKRKQIIFVKLPWLRPPLPRMPLHQGPLLQFRQYNQFQQGRMQMKTSLSNCTSTMPIYYHSYQIKAGQNRNARCPVGDEEMFDLSICCVDVRQ